MSRQLKAAEKNEQLKKLLNTQLKSNLQLNQFLSQQDIDEELQSLVQCYLHDLIDWLRLNMDTELISSVNDPLILLRDNVLEDIEQVVEGKILITPLLSKHDSK